MAAAGTKAKLDVTVQKPNPYTFDLGLLLANDPNPISTSQPADAAAATNDDNTTADTTAPLDPIEAQLSALARDGAQSLINQLLTTCPITSTNAGVLLNLPQPTTLLPREKPVPAAKPPTKWEAFAAKKGIKPRTREQRRARTSKFNEDTGVYERTYGYDGRDKRKRAEEGMVQKDWLVEVDEKKDAEARAKKELIKDKAARKKRRSKQ